MEKNTKVEFWAIIGGNLAVTALVIALFTWNRSEANADRRDMMNIMHSIEQEMKDFHGRLCAIEERNKGK